MSNDEQRYIFGDIDVVTTGGFDRAVHIMHAISLADQRPMPSFTRSQAIGMLGHLGAWNDMGAYAEYRGIGQRRIPLPEQKERRKTR